MIKKRDNYKVVQQLNHFQVLICILIIHNIVCCSKIYEEHQFKLQQTIHNFLQFLLQDAVL